MNIAPNKKRLESHFIYDWIKYVAVILAIIVAFAFFYSATVKQLTDIEELRVVLCSYNYDQTKMNDASAQALAAIGKEVNPELKHVGVNNYSYADQTTESVDLVKFEVELTDVLGDVYILPSVEKYREEGPPLIAGDDGKSWQYTPHYRFSHQLVCGRDTFIPIDELIAQEKASNNALRRQRAERLEQIFSQYNPTDLYYEHVRYYVLSPYKEPTYFEQDKVNGEYVAKKWGVNLSVLDQNKLKSLFIGETKDEFILSVRINSKNHSDSIAFLIWLFENYA